MEFDKKLKIIFIYGCLSIIVLSFFVNFEFYSYKPFHSIQRIENSTIHRKLNATNYYRDLPIRNSSGQGVCVLTLLDPWNKDAKKLITQTKRYDGCKKHTPLSYVKERRLFINQTVNITYFSAKISNCDVAKVNFNASDLKKLFSFGNF